MKQRSKEIITLNLISLPELIKLLGAHQLDMDRVIKVFGYETIFRLQYLDFISPDPNCIFQRIYNWMRWNDVDATYYTRDGGTLDDIDDHGLYESVCQESEDAMLKRFTL